MPEQTVRDRILETLRNSSKPLAEHDFGYMGTESSGVTRELRRMADDKLVVGERRYDLMSGKRKRYKEWRLVRAGEVIKTKEKDTDPAPALAQSPAPAPVSGEAKVQLELFPPEQQSQREDKNSMLSQGGK